MDKSSHTATVPREYIEMLEKSYEENNNVRKENIHGVVAEIPNGKPVLLLRLNKITDRDFSGIAIIDDKGKQLMQFSRKDFPVSP